LTGNGYSRRPVRGIGAAISHVMEVRVSRRIFPTATAAVAIAHSISLLAFVMNTVVAREGLAVRFGPNSDLGGAMRKDCERAKGDREAGCLHLSWTRIVKGDLRFAK
jgi:hypothetical protein